MTLRTPNDPETLALSALAATLTDERRAQRFLAVTGVDIDGLRRRLGDPALLTALIAFLEAHEPDLVSVAAEIGVEPEELVAARQLLEAWRQRRRMQVHLSPRIEEEQ